MRISRSSLYSEPALDEYNARLMNLIDEPYTPTPDHPRIVYNTGIKHHATDMHPDPVPRRSSTLQEV